jgi:hypothetical protein
LRAFPAALVVVGDNEEPRCVTKLSRDVRRERSGRATTSRRGQAQPPGRVHVLFALEPPNITTYFGGFGFEVSAELVEPVQGTENELRSGDDVIRRAGEERAKAEALVREAVREPIRAHLPGPLGNRFRQRADRELARRRDDLRCEAC